MSPLPAQPTGHEVRIRAAVKRYGKATALKGLDLDIPGGRFLVLLGPSGSGKSTLARCLAGVERLDAGSIHLGAQLVSDGKRHLPPERRNLAMVFQDYALWPHQSALGNVSYALRRHRLPKQESRVRALEALERMGLAALAQRYPHELSGGEQQRVALARAVVARPGLLLFDEPLSNLDADLRERLRIEISTLTRERGATAVYITHDQAEAFALADEIAVLDHGELVQLGPPEQIYRHPATPFVARFTGLAGELPGRFLGCESGEVVVQVGGDRLRGRLASELQVGAPVRLFVRPDATQIVSGDLSPGDGTMRATVLDVAFRGRGYDHVVSAAAGELTSVFSQRRWERGEAVTVRLDPEGCIAYPDPGAGAVVVGNDEELTPVRLRVAAVANSGGADE